MPRGLLPYLALGLLLGQVGALCFDVFAAGMSFALTTFAACVFADLVMEVRALQ